MTTMRILICAEGWMTVSNHTVVVHPESTEDVVKIVKIAVKYRMPITPYSGGSSLEGSFRAVSVTLRFLVL